MHGIEKGTLYLVTDSDLPHRGAASLQAHVEAAIRGGVGIVQLREKEADTQTFLEKARALVEVCSKYDVPLIINDRVDIALAVGAGVHVGQNDMACSEVRKLIGPDHIIGVSVNTIHEAEEAIKAGADYLGIGAVYDTTTKALTNPTLGTSGVQKILEHIEKLGSKIQTVAIGGINAANIDRIMFSTAAGTRTLEGVAVVSAIMASSDPEGVSRGLKRLMSSEPAFHPPQARISASELDATKLFEIVKKVRHNSPLIQQMTNNVVKNFSANVTLAVGASPVMSEVKEEAEDLAKVNGAFLLNMGMVSGIDIPTYAVQQNNKYGKPTVLDPVGAGGTSFRREATKTYLDNAYFDVIKGNEAEIRAAAGLPSDQKGVDNVSIGSIEARIQLTATVARKHRNIVVVTGVEDVVSDGQQSVTIKGGHELLGDITGSGCSLGSIIASFLAISSDNKLATVVAGIVLYGLAAEHAVLAYKVHGPGTFVPAFLDSLYLLSKDEALFTKQYESGTLRLEFYDA